MCIIHLLLLVFVVSIGVCVCVCGVCVDDDVIGVIIRGFILLLLLL